MQERSSVSQALTTRGRMLLLLLNFLPLLHVALCAGILLWPADIPASARALLFLAGLYLVPGLVGRSLKRGCADAPRIAIGSRAFFFWWASMQSQMVFARLPLLEEILRLVPGLYSLWLRIWGSRIGRLTFWSPGTVILDRGFLDFGDDIVLGAGVRFNPHVIRKNSEGKLELQLAPVRVGDRASVGGYSLLTAGTVVPADEATTACLVSPPFGEWKDGKRIRK